MTQPLDPVFAARTVDDDPRDGYWIHAVDVDGDGVPDLVASGLTAQNIVWYHNPSGRAPGPWTRRVVLNKTPGTMTKPVALEVAELAPGAAGGGPDLLFSHDYGECMFGCRPNDGKISWLRNPRPHDGFWPDAPWELNPIAGWVATHRLGVGGSTADWPSWRASPVVGAPPQPPDAAVHAPVRITLFEPADPAHPERAWTRTLIDDEHFRIVHGVYARRFPDTPHPELDSFVLAGKEGLTWLGLGSDGAWVRRNIASGTAHHESSELHGAFRGCGNLAFGRVGGRDFARILTAEPFHGNVVALYTRPADGPMFDRPWDRTVIDEFKQPVQRAGDPADYDAVVHHVVAADFDGDGDDEFLIALRGPDPKGVFYYKFDPDGRVLVRKQVSDVSAARIAVADFDGDGRLDFATTAYQTEGYYLDGAPQVRVFYNEFGRLRDPAPAAPYGANG